MSKIRPYVLHETNYNTVKDTNYQLAVLPWGATEAHNFHLPYGTDTLLAEHIANDSAKVAYELGSQLIVLPSIPYGVNTGQSDIPLCVNMHPSTQLAVLKDIVQVLEASNIPKLAILNAHGGNDFKQMIRELYTDYPNIFICSADWWKAGRAVDHFDEPGDHAGELETSVMLHLAGDWVLPLEIAGEGKERRFSVEGLRKGWVKSQRKWSEVTEDTGTGDPKHSTAESGSAFYSECVGEIGKFFHELAETPNDGLYEQ